MDAGVGRVLWSELPGSIYMFDFMAENSITFCYSSFKVHFLGTQMGLCFTKELS